jgi:hypothetical protein
MNNKKLGRDTMRYAEESYTISQSQYGSRKGCRSYKVITGKVLNYNIIRQKKIAATHVGLDATQCFDRMTHSTSALCLMKHGAPPTAIQSLYGVLQTAEHKVITPYGLSVLTYGGKARAKKGLLPPQGEGQGSDHAPTSWATTSTKLMGVMEN